MGGASCKHENKQYVSKSDKFLNNLFTDCEFVTYKCMDCPHSWTEEHIIGKLSKFQYSSHVVDPKLCQHQHLDVDESTCQKVRGEKTLSGTFLRFFMGGMDGIQYEWYLSAVGTCQRCNKKILVRADYHRVWRNQVQVEERCSNWVPLKKTVFSDKRESHEAFVEVN